MEFLVLNQVLARFRTGILKTADTLDTISLMTSNLSDIKFFFNHIRVKRSKLSIC